MNSSYDRWFLSGYGDGEDKKMVAKEGPTTFLFYPSGFSGCTPREAMLVILTLNREEDPLTKWTLGWTYACNYPTRSKGCYVLKGTKRFSDLSPGVSRMYR